MTTSDDNLGYEDCVPTLASKGEDTKTDRKSDRRQKKSSHVKDRVRRSSLFHIPSGQDDINTADEKASKDGRRKSRQHDRRRSSVTHIAAPKHASRNKEEETILKRKDGNRRRSLFHISDPDRESTDGASGSDKQHHRSGRRRSSLFHVTDVVTQRRGRRKTATERANTHDRATISSSTTKTNIKRNLNPFARRSNKLSNSSKRSSNSESNSSNNNSSSSDKHNHKRRAAASSSSKKFSSRASRKPNKSASHKEILTELQANEGLVTRLQNDPESLKLLQDHIKKQYMGSAA